MNSLQAIAFALLLVEALVLLALIIRQGRRQLPWPPGARDAASRRAERDVHRLMRELDALVKEIDQRMTSRVEQLESLLAQAEDLAAELRTSPLWPDQLTEGEATDSEGEERSEDSEESNAAPQEQETVAEGDRPSLNEASEAIRLAKEGHDVVEIAQRLGRPTGEVQLLLNLRRVGSPRT